MVEALLREARQEPEQYPGTLPILEELRRAEVLVNRQLNDIYFHSERIYQHSITQVNYTTYDCQRDQDTPRYYVSAQG